MSIANRIAKTPAKNGPWAWRDYLPANITEWLALRDRAIDARPDGVDVLRFADWTLAEMRGESVSMSSKTEAKYRRTLYELAEAAPPPAKVRRRRDRGLSDVRGAASMAAGVVGGAVVAHATGAPLGLVVGALIAGNPREDRYVKSSTAWAELGQAA